MSEFSGLQKHEKTQHALVGLGSAALAAVVALPRKGGPNFPKGVILMKCIIKLKINKLNKKNNQKTIHRKRVRLWDLPRENWILSHQCDTSESASHRYCNRPTHKEP